MITLCSNFIILYFELLRFISSNTYLCLLNIYTKYYWNKKQNKVLLCYLWFIMLQPHYDPNTIYFKGTERECNEFKYCLTMILQWFWHVKQSSEDLNRKALYNVSCMLRDLQKPNCKTLLRQKPVWDCLFVNDYSPFKSSGNHD